MKCPHCTNGIHPSWARFPLGQEQHWDPSETNYVWEGRWLLCPVCGNVVVELMRRYPGGTLSTTVLAWPKSGQRPLPPEVTGRWKEDFAEAVDVLPRSPKASAALSRRMLQDLLREKAGAKPSNFYDEIEEVLGSGAAPSYLSENLHTVRTVWNWAAHATKNKNPKSTNPGEIVEVEPGEAEFLLDVLEGAFDFYIVQPERARLQREAIEAKRTGAASPE